MLTTIVIYLLSFLLVAIMAFGIITYFKIDLSRMVFVTVASVFFPIIIQFGGKDALTTSGIMVLITFGWYLVSSLQKGKRLLGWPEWWIYALIVFGAISTKLALDLGYIITEDIGPAVRQYFSFVTSLLLFILIKNSLSDPEEADATATAKKVERLINLILILTSVHIVISIINKYVPATIDYVSIFYPAESEALLPEGQDRLTSFVFSYENYGEFLAAICPLAVYKLASTRSKWWFLCLALFACGVLLSVTRSGIVLFALALLVSIFYQFRANIMHAVIFITLLLGTLLGFTTLYPQVVDDVLGRFTLAEAAFSSGGSIFDTINRDNLPEIWDFVMSELSLSGHSLVRIDFHNLFLTTLYQIGVIGAFLYFTLLLYPVMKLVGAFFRAETENRALVFSFLMFAGLFLINEMKVEFTRAESYSELCWGLFALCYLAAKPARRTVEDVVPIQPRVRRLPAASVGMKNGE